MPDPSAHPAEPHLGLGWARWSLRPGCGGLLCPLVTDDPLPPSPYRSPPKPWQSTPTPHVWASLAGEQSCPCRPGGTRGRPSSPVGVPGPPELRSQGLSQRPKNRPVCEDLCQPADLLVAWVARVRVQAVELCCISTPPAPQPQAPSARAASPLGRCCAPVKATEASRRRHMRASTRLLSCPATIFLWTLSYLGPYLLSGSKPPCKRPLKARGAFILHFLPLPVFQVNHAQVAWLWLSRARACLLVSRPRRACRAPRTLSPESAPCGQKGEAFTESCRPP